MSFVLIAPEFVTAAAGDLTNLGSSISAANASAASATTQVLAAGADEVSARIAALFGGFGLEYQAISAQVAAYHQRFVQALSTGAGAYASAEAAAAEQIVLGVINAPTQALLGRPLIGDGANATTPGGAGGAGGLLFGNGGAGAAGAPAAAKAAPAVTAAMAPTEGQPPASATAATVVTVVTVVTAARASARPAASAGQEALEASAAPVQAAEPTAMMATTANPATTAAEAPPATRQRRRCGAPACARQIGAILTSQVITWFDSCRATVPAPQWMHTR